MNLMMDTPTNKKRKNQWKESASVYCFIKDVRQECHQLFCEAKDSKTVIFYPPDNSKDFNLNKKVQYSFSHVFNNKSTQKELFDVVALPLIKDLLKGRCGLLFKYELTSDENSCILTGTPQDSGILFRCFDVLFNSIKYYKNHKFVVQPNNNNWFDIVLKNDISVLRQNQSDLVKKTVKLKNKRKNYDWKNRIPDYTTVNIAKDRTYAVFVSYVELYKNYIYDLIEGTSTTLKQSSIFNSKMLREDAHHNMFVYGAIEREVKTVEDMIEVFERGQERRYVNHSASTADNSNAIFTIKVVQVPLNIQEENTLLDSSKIVCSQLSIVDLSVKKFTLQSENYGQKIRKYGHINRPLKILNTCMQALQEKRTPLTPKVMPYKGTKLTHLFKSFFEGKGKIKMIVCVDPTENEFKNNVNPLNFAEMSQDLYPSTSGLPVLCTPVSNSKFLKMAQRRKQHKSLKKKKKQLPDQCSFSSYSSVLSFSHHSLRYENESNCDSLTEFLNKQKLQKKTLKENLNQQKENFRKNLINADKEIVQLKQEKLLLRMDLDAREYQLKDIEKRLNYTETSVENLEKKIKEYQHQNDSLKLELERKDRKILDLNADIRNMKLKIQEKMAEENRKMKIIMEKSIADNQEELKKRLCSTVETLKKLKEIVNANDWDHSYDNLIYSPLPNLEAAEISVPQIFEQNSSQNFLSKEKLQSSVEGSVGKNILRELNSNNGFTSSFVNVQPCSSKENACHLKPQVDSKSTTCISRNLESVPLGELGKKSVCSNASSRVLQLRNKDTLSEMKSISHLYCAGESAKLNNPSIANEKPNFPVVSIKRENFSLFQTQSEVELKTFSNLPYVYRMTNSAPRKSCFVTCVNFLCRPLTVCGKGLANISSCSKKLLYQDMWIEHKPIENLELNALLLPTIKKKKSVCKLQLYDICNASKYMLQHQVADSHGGVETQLYKGDIIHSSSGGVQVIFKDVEKIKLVVPQTNFFNKKNNLTK